MKSQSSSEHGAFAFPERRVRQRGARKPSRPFMLRLLTFALRGTQGPLH